MNTGGNSKVFRFGRHVNVSLLALSVSLLPRFAAPAVAQEVPGQSTEPAQVLSGTNVVDVAHLSDATYSVQGDLSNSGILYLVSSNSSVTSASLVANNITNTTGSTITTVLPAGGLPGYSGLVSNLSLSLFAANSIINSGQITSAGSLSLSAGNSIVNALPVGVTGATPVMQAVDNLNIIANQITNTGIMASSTANLNFGSLTPHDIIVQNTSGLLQALQGTVNVRGADFSEKMNFALLGGNVLANELNIFSGSGIVSVNVEDLQAVVNASAGEGHFVASSGQLSIGNLNFIGDPTIFNRTGDVLIDSSLVFAGQPLAIVASGNITSTVPGVSIVTSSATGDAGNITLIAGAQFTVSDPDIANPFVPVSIDISGASASGGSINLDGGTSIARLEARSVSANGTGGNVTMIAYNGAAANSGQIKLPPTMTISTGGNGTGGNGNVTILAGQAQTAQFSPSIVVGNVNTTGGSGSGGDILLATGQPTSPLKVVNGNLKELPPAPTSYSTHSGITTGDLSSPGKNITVLSGGYLWLENVRSDGVHTGDGGTINIVQEVNDTFVVNPGGDAIHGILSATSGPAGGAGGSISLTFNGRLETSSGTVMSVSAINGKGGSIHLEADELIIPSTAFIDASGRSGAGGNITLKATLLVLPSGESLNANADGGDFNGGTVHIESPDLDFTGPAVFGLSANGSGNGNGGTINVLTSAGENIILDPVAGITISVTGGDSKSSYGDAGTINLEGGQVILRSGGINAVPMGQFGRGMNLSVTASSVFQSDVSVESSGGPSGSGGTININANELRVTGDIAANGSGPGSGGAVNIFLDGASGTLILGDTLGNNFIKGNITADGGPTGSGGEVRVHVLNNGIARSSPSTDGNISVLTGAGKGGLIEIITDGVIDLANGIPLTVNASARDFDGGTIRVQSKKGVVHNIFGWQANGSGNGNGGKIEVDAASITGATLISARGGNGTGNGGTIVLKSRSGPLSVTAASLNVSPGANGGNGGNLEFNAESVHIGGSLHVNGSGSGNGGSVKIHTSTFTDFVIGTSSPAPNSYVTGTIHANSGPTGGNGGTIELYSAYGFTSAPESLEVSSATGAGGTIRLLGGPLRSSGGTLDVSSSQGGGTIVLGSVPVTTSGNLLLDASSTNGSGGTVILGDTSQSPIAGAALEVGNTPRRLSITTAGQSSGGTVVLNLVSSSISLDPVALQMTPSGVIADGGRLQIGSTERVGSANTVQISGGLDLRGHGSGEGGTLDIFLNGGDFEVSSRPASSQAITGPVLTGSDSGPGGRVRIDSFGGNLQITPSLLNAKSVSGDGGEIVLNTISPSGSGTLTISSGTIAVDGTGPSGEGGLIDIAAVLNLPSGLTLNASGSGTGNGGTIKVLNQAGLIDITGGANSLTVIATGGSSGSTAGNGGTVDLSARTVRVSSPFLNAAPAGNNGNGASIAINASTRLNWTGDLNADGAGTGRGGNVQINHGSTQFSIGGTTGSFVSGELTATAPARGSGGSILVTGNPGYQVFINSLVDAGSQFGIPGTVEFRSSSSITGSGSVGGVLNPAPVINLPGQTGPLLLGGTALNQTAVAAPHILVPDGQGVFANNITFNTPHLTNNGVIGGFWTGGVVPPAASIVIQNSDGVLVDGTGSMVGRVTFDGRAGAVVVTQGAIIGTYTGIGAQGVSITVGPPVLTSAALGLSTQATILLAGNQLPAVIFTPERISSSTVLATDVTKFSLKIAETSTDSRANQVFAVLSSDDADLYSEADTEVEEKGEQIYLSKGKTLVDAKNSRTVVTPSGTLQVPRDSAHIVEVRPNGVVRVVSLAGNAPAVFYKDASKSEQFKCERGQELIVASKDIVEEELIPIDGCDRSFVEASVTKSGTQQIKARVKVKQVASRDLLIAGVLVHIGNNRKPSRLAANIQRSINSESKPVVAEKSDKGLFYVADGARVKLTGTKIDLSSGEAVVFPRERSAITTPFGELVLQGRQVATIENDGDVFRIRVCTGSSAAEMRVGNKLFLLNAGEELALMKRADQSKLSDGVARRRTLVTKVSRDLFAMTSEFSLSGYLSSPACLLKQSQLDGQRMKVEGKILKSAAALQMVAANHGPYMPPGAITRKSSNLTHN